MKWICLARVLLTGPYDIYGKSTDAGIYSNVGDKTKAVEVGFFQILMDVGIYMSIICILVSAMMIIVGANGKSQKLAEAKGFFTKALLVSFLIFGICGIIKLVIGAGLDS